MKSARKTPNFERLRKIDLEGRKPLRRTETVSLLASKRRREKRPGATLREPRKIAIHYCRCIKKAARLNEQLCMGSADAKR
jgi:hypothetical protein